MTSYVKKLEKLYQAHPENFQKMIGLRLRFNDYPYGTKTKLQAWYDNGRTLVRIKNAGFVCRMFEQYLEAV